MPLIVFEGTECAGKTTLCERLCADNKDYVYVKLPDRSTEIGQLIDKFLKNQISFSENAKDNEVAAQLLFAANNMQHCSRLHQLLADGKTLIVDRYIPSGVVYHSIAINSDETDFILMLNKHMPKPDLIIVLEVDPEVAALRRTDYGSERNDNVELQRKIAQGFKDFLGESALYVDASQSAEQVYNQVLSYIN